MILVFALLGLFVGSFLNVCIDRLPRGQSIVYPPSHCAGCRHKLGFFDLFPVLSYLRLSGRCHYCEVSIPRRIPIVEGVTGLLFAMLYWQYGLGLQLAIAMIYACFLLVIFVIDLETMYVLSIVVYPAMVLALAFSFFWPGIQEIGDWGLGAGGWGMGIGGKLASSLLGGVIGSAMMALPWFISRLVYHREGMGKGDIQLGALVGLMTGFPFALVALFLAVISGGLISGGLLLFKVKKRTDAIPFGPFLAASAMVTLLWGQNIMTWYLG
ncbi:MAG: prepilin peptidase [Dehalococcoidales bacterium]|nr:prepilin peptidase [Dehalococcoidales bacterium]